MSENAIDLSRFSKSACPPNGQVLWVCFIGSLVPSQGRERALSAALPLLRDKRTYSGHHWQRADGKRVARLVAAENIEEAAGFHGWIPHDHLQGIEVAAQVFVFPSVRRFSEGSVVEALALSLVPLAVDYGGLGKLLAIDGEIAVPLASVGETIRETDSALLALACNAGRVASISVAARAWH